MSKRRVTDLDNNKKIFLPKAMNAITEARLEVRCDKFRKINKDYMKNNCEEDGSQEVNLPADLKKALKSLNKKIKDKHLIVVPTDKSGKFAVCTVSTYRQMGLSNVKSDKEIDLDKVNKIQKQLNGHVASLNRCMNVGKQWGHQQRIHESTTSDSNLVPPGYILIKDHKEVEIGKLPGARLVISNCRGMGEPLATLLSNLVESLAMCMEDPFQVLSSEDLISKLEDYNKQVDEEGESQATTSTPTSPPKVPNHAVPPKAGCPTNPPQTPNPSEQQPCIFLGADAIKLFPSLEQSQVAKLVAQAFLDSKMEMSEMNYKEVAKYVAVNWLEGRIKLEGLHRICPKRKKTRGRKPTITGKEQAKAKLTEDEDSLWVFPEREATKLEERKLVAAMLEISIIASFGLHIYSFDGRIYQQKVGGPIGSRLTMAVSRIIMSLLGTKLRKYLTDADVKIWMEACYVDDLRFILSLLPSFMVWNKKTKMFEDNRAAYSQNCSSQTSPPKVPNHADHPKAGCPPNTPPLPNPTASKADWEETKTYDELEEHTRRQVNEALNSVFSFLQFTTELQSEYKDNYMPTLDLKCRLTSENKVVFQFYEKETTSRYCVMAKSAMGDQSKIAILTQEVNRRLLNTSEQEPQEKRDNILSTFQEKMQT